MTQYSCARLKHLCEMRDAGARFLTYLAADIEAMFMAASSETMAGRHSGGAEPVLDRRAKIILQFQKITEYHEELEDRVEQAQKRNDRSGTVSPEDMALVEQYKDDLRGFIIKSAPDLGTD
ncbi:MAG: hypothetical protein ACWA5L_02450 [bacterium]